MASKINIIKGAKLDISARSGDNFSLTVEILDENNVPPFFSTPNYLGTSEAEEIMIFVIFSNEYEPLLLASNTKLCINNPNGTDTQKNNAIHATAVADFLAKYAGDNTFEEEVTNFNTTLESNSSAVIGNLADNGFSTVGKFYEPIEYNSSSESILPSASIGDANKGANYIAYGVINSFSNDTAAGASISFKADEIRLPKGNYKYALKNLSTPAKYNESSSEDRIVYLDCTTWLHGKIKINEV